MGVEMERRTFFDDVRQGLSGKPLWNLISTVWTLAFSFIYFEEFIYSFSGKPIDPVSYTHLTLPTTPYV